MILIAQILAFFSKLRSTNYKEIKKCILTCETEMNYLDIKLNKILYIFSSVFIWESFWRDAQLK